MLALLGSIILLCTGTSWAKHALFPEVGAQGTSALRLGFAALLMLMFWRRWHGQTGARLRCTASPWAP